MKKIGIVRSVIAGVVMSAFAAGAAAQAVNEQEPNYPVAQSLTLGADGNMVVKGIVGVMFGSSMHDADLYAFHANEGDVLDLDIDGGRKNGGTGRDVWTVLTLFGPAPAYEIKRQTFITEHPDARDDGSINIFDPYIYRFRADTSGTHIVAVTGYSTLPKDGGNIEWGTLFPFSNGDYTLTVSGATAMPSAPLVQQINIEIKPGSREFAPINLKSKGVIPVALLSSGEFDALKADAGSLTFGATGDESSLRKCAVKGEDVNGDGKPDLVCHFETQLADFGPDNTEGVLKGTIDGQPFEGRGVLKVVPAIKKQK